MIGVQTGNLSNGLNHEIAKCFLSEFQFFHMRLLKRSIGRRTVYPKTKGSTAYRPQNSIPAVNRIQIGSRQFGSQLFSCYKLSL